MAPIPDVLKTSQNDDKIISQRGEDNNIIICSVSSDTEAGQVTHNEETAFGDDKILSSMSSTSRPALNNMDIKQGMQPSRSGPIDSEDFAAANNTTSLADKELHVITDEKPHVLDEKIDVLTEKFDVLNGTIDVSNEYNRNIDAASVIETGMCFENKDKGLTLTNGEEPLKDVQGSETTPAGEHLKKTLASVRDEDLPSKPVKETACVSRTMAPPREAETGKFCHDDSGEVEKHDEEGDKKIPIGKISDDTRESENKDKDVYDVDDDDDDDGVPIDRGWAWMIDLSCFALNLIYGVQLQAHSVFLLDYTDQFNCSVSVVTAMMSVATIAYCIGTQVSSNLLITYFSVRQVTTWSSIANAAATLLFVASVNIPTFFIINIVKHTAAGCSVIITLTLVGYYFRRRRALATSLGILGMSVSSMLTPPLARYLRDHYGFRGCFLLLAGFEMHGIAASLLLRPLSSYKSRKVQRQTKQASSATADPLELEEKAPFLSDSSPTTQSDAQEKLGETDAEALSLLANGCSSINSIRDEILIDRPVLFTSEAKQTVLDSKCSEQIFTDGDKISMASVDTSGLREVGVAKDEKWTREDPAKEGITEDNDWPVLTTVMMGSAVSITSAMTPEVVAAPENKHRGNKCQVCSLMKQIFNISLLKNFLCVLVTMAYVFYNAGIMSMMYLPSYATQVGISPQKAAVLLTIVGAMDIAGRVIFGVLADLKILRPLTLVALASLSLGIADQFVGLCQNFVQLVVIAVLHGLMANIGLSLHSALIVDILGLQYLTSMWALCSLFFTTGMMIQYPIHGVLIEATGNFVATFHFLGTSHILGAVLLLCEPWVRPLQLARERRDGSVTQL